MTVFSTETHVNSAEKYCVIVARGSVARFIFGRRTTTALGNSSTRIENDNSLKNLFFAQI